MARTVPDVALFLDTMAGLCGDDPMTFAAPARSFSAAVSEPTPPGRVAYAATIAGSPVDRESREICRAGMQHFEAMGATVEEITLDIEDLEETFLALRAQQFVIDREQQLARHRQQIKADIIWNTELGLKQSTSVLAKAERGRAALYRRFAVLFERYDLLVTPGANTPAFDVNLRHPASIDGVELSHYLSASLLTSAVTLCASPALSLPCGFDRFGRPIGLQLVGRPRGEAALLAAGALYEAATGLAARVPIVPRPGTVPP